MDAILGNSLLGFFPLLLHDSSQRLIDPRLVAAPRFLEPVQHVRVQTQRDRLLDRPVPCSNLGAYIARALGLTGADAFSPSILPFLTLVRPFIQMYVLSPYV